MRVLGVDLGRSRIGIAVGVVEGRVATPRQNLKASGSLARDAQAVAELARREEAELVVVGVPEREGGDDRQARACRTFAERLRSLGWDVSLVDEALTSVESHAALREHGLTAAQRRKVVDGEAAARILERYFGDDA